MEPRALVWSQGDHDVHIHFGHAAHFPRELFIKKGPHRRHISGLLLSKDHSLRRGAFHSRFRRSIEASTEDLGHSSDNVRLYETCTKYVHLYRTK